MVERSDRMWSTGEGNGKPLQYSCLENPMNSMKKQKDRTLKDELPRLVGAQYGREISGKITPERMKRWSQSGCVRDPRASSRMETGVSGAS